MKLESSKSGDVVVLKLIGRMDAVTAPDFEKECDSWLGQGDKDIVVQMNELEYISSAGLRSLLSSAKKLKAEGGSLKFCNLSGMVQEVFTLSGFAHMFPIFSSLEEALEG